MRKFFRVLFRINAILICLLLLSLIAVLLWVFVQSIPSRGDSSGSLLAKVTGGDAKDKDVPKPSIGSMDALTGTTIVRGTVQLVSNYDKFSGSSFSSGGNSTTTCNFIFFDTATQQKSVLLPGNNSVIVHSQDYCFPDQPLDKRRVRWTSYAIADKDTNKDNFISSDDLQSFGVAQANGQDYHVYLEGIDQLLQTQLVGENDFYAFYEKKGIVFVSRIDLASKKVLTTDKLF